MHYLVIVYIFRYILVRAVSRNLRPVCEEKTEASNLIFKLNEVFNYHVFLNKIEKPNVFLFGCLLEIKSKLWPKNNMVKNCRDLQPRF
jgi:hypothetical protein